jgi:hypothetical protein
LTDAMTLSAGSNITITTSGNSLAIAAATQPQAFSGYEMITVTSTMSGTPGVTTTGWQDWAVPIMTQNGPLIGNNGKAIAWNVFWFKPSNYVTTGNVATNLKGQVLRANVQ